MSDNYTELRCQLDAVRDDLAKLSSLSVESSGGTVGASLNQSDLEVVEGVDLLITSNELNLHHGTGVLLNRIFDPNTSIHLRTHNDYADKGPFRSHLVDAANRSRSAVFSLVLDALATENIRRIICVPFFPEDYLVGIAAKNFLGVPMVVWMMDDLIIHNSKVPHERALELFDLADIRFVISPEMRDAYEERFRRKFYMLPATVEAKLITKVPSSNISQNLAAKTCAMIGNVWSQAWFERLAEMIKKSGWTVHWYGPGLSCGWLNITADKLIEHNIIEKGFLPEQDLIDALVTYPFSIIPTGSGNDDDDRPGVTLLSLPSRMSFLLAATYLPMLVVGSEKSCAAKFARRFGVGFSVNYDEHQFLEAIAKLGDASFSAQCRSNAAAVAMTFSADSLAEWIGKCCDEGVAIDDRFEGPFRREQSDSLVYVEPPVPRDLHENLHSIFHNLRRLAGSGYQPDFIIDVGASSGVWSDTASRLFPRARFVLVEPLSDRYPQLYYEKNAQFERVEAAASNECGKATFHVHHDLLGSSLFSPEDGHEYQSTEVTATTLDMIRVQKEITGRGILKIDAKNAEHLVIEGAISFLEQVDFLFMELTLRRSLSEAKTFLEMVNQMEQLGFRYFDELGEGRCSMQGILKQKNVLFVRESAAQRLGI
jgi:FkbM family methyltransferase